MYDVSKKKTGESQLGGGGGESIEKREGGKKGGCFYRSERMDQETEAGLSDLGQEKQVSKWSLGERKRKSGGMSEGVTSFVMEQQQQQKKTCYMPVK